MFNHLSMRAWLVAAAVLLTLSRPISASERAGPPGEVTPGKTAVLFLPALDVTRDAVNMQAPRQAVIRHREQVEFIKRQFKVLGESLALRAANLSPKIELASISARTAENLDDLARRTQADWAVSTVVEEVEMTTVEGGEFKASTRLLLQVWDAGRHTWLINRSFTGQASGNGAPPMVFMRSLDEAVRGAWADRLAPYPQVITLEMEDSLIDYLHGQIEPFIGDPGKPFAGLKGENTSSTSPSIAP